MIRVDEHHYGSYLVDISDEELEQLVEIALCVKVTLTELIERFVAGGIRMNHSDLIMEGRIDGDNDDNT